MVSSRIRQAVVTIDQVASSWPGAKINTYVNGGGGLQLADNAIRGQNIVEINLPKSSAVFSTVFYVNISQEIINHVVYMTLNGPDSFLMVGYDTTKGVFYLEDQLGNRNETAVEFKVPDYLTFGIVQNATTRKLFIYSFSVDAVGDSEMAYGPIGNFTAAFLYSKFN